MVEGGAVLEQPAAHPHTRTGHAAHQKPRAGAAWSLVSDTVYSLSSAVQACTMSLAAVT